jgi:hypothetical protein
MVNKISNKNRLNFDDYFSFIVRNFLRKIIFYVLEMIKMKQLFMIIQYYK